MIFIEKISTIHSQTGWTIFIFLSSSFVQFQHNPLKAFWKERKRRMENPYQVNDFESGKENFIFMLFRLWGRVGGAGIMEIFFWRDLRYFKVSWKVLKYLKVFFSILKHPEAFFLFLKYSKESPKHPIKNKMAFK